jgi:hypothetical protein
MPKVEVGIDGGFDDTRRAVAILVALQRLSALPIDPTVTSLQDAITSSNPAILISAAGWTDTRITLPVAADSTGEVTVQNAGGSGDLGMLSLRPHEPFGALQTMRDGDRTVLVATSNGAPDQLDALLVWVNSDFNRWSRVTGNALVAAPGREPVAVTTENPQSPKVTVAERRSNVLWSAGGVLLALLVAVGALIVLRRKRTRKQS